MLRRSAAARPAGGQVTEQQRARRVFLSGLAIGAAATAAIGLVTLGIVALVSRSGPTTPGQGPAAIVATVQFSQLRNTAVVPGLVVAGRTITVRASPAYHTAIVTRTPVPAGQQVRAGQVVVEINGNPVIVLHGAFGAYRSLHIGDSGPDVSQLQQALIQLGYPDSDPPAVFGVGTSLAVSELFRAVGYPVPLFRPPGLVGPPRHRHPRPATPFLPMSDVTFIPDTTARVAPGAAGVGSDVTSKTVLRLWTGGVFVQVALTGYQAGLIHSGSTADISSAAIGISLPGAVSSVSPAAPAGFRATVSGLRPLPAGLLGHQVQVTLWSAATSGPVLAVPVAAIVAGPHGATTVVRLQPGGQQVRVAVVTGVAADGLVAVRPTVPGTLRPGDSVVVGAGT